jgi:hypothetical protein
MKQIVVCLLVLLLSSSAFSMECHETFIKEPTPFLGNGGEIIILGDGSIWKEVSYQYLYLYEYNPSVIVCANGLMILGSYKFSLVPVK